MHTPVWRNGADWRMEAAVWPARCVPLSWDAVQGTGALTRRSMACEHTVRIGAGQSLLSARAITRSKEPCGRTVLDCVPSLLAGAREESRTQGHVLGAQIRSDGDGRTHLALRLWRAHPPGPSGHTGALPVDALIHVIVRPADRRKHASNLGSVQVRTCDPTAELRGCSMNAPASS